MELKDYKQHIEGLAKMNNPSVSQCIALLRQLYGKLEDTEKELAHEIDMNAQGRTEEKESELGKAAKKCARTGTRHDLQEYLKLRRNYL